MDITFTIFQVITLIFSVMLHEISHGLMAERLGDPTARLAGRITLNPLKHIDLFGSILLPLILMISGSPIVLGWAKPVPYNPSGLKNPQKAAAKIAAAGPLSNFALAAAFAVLLRFMIAFGTGVTLIEFFASIVIVNLFLGVFNLIPIPPLDGSKVLFGFLPMNGRGYSLMRFLERFGFVLIFALLFFGGTLLWPLVSGLFQLLTGQSLF